MDRLDLGRGRDRRLRPGRMTWYVAATPGRNAPGGTSRPGIPSMAERSGSLCLAAGPVEVVFVREGDRWTHEVRCRGATVCASVEGAWPAAGDPRWPASPALQEVTAAPPGARPALLAVGHAGRSHYAASVAADPGAADTLVFEFACRVVEQPGWLGSTYRLPGAGPEPVRIAAADPGGDLPRTVRWSYRIGPEGIVAAGRADGPARPA
jgi:hypothetical protein